MFKMWLSRLFVSLWVSLLLLSNRITTQLGAMKLGLLKDLDVAPLPFKTETLKLFLVWHRREDDDPAHQWFRQKIIETVNSIIGD